MITFLFSAGEKRVGLRPLAFVLGVFILTVQAAFAIETVDASFNAGNIQRQGRIYALAAQPDGKTIVGGNFATVNGSNFNNLVRLNADSTVDASFTVGTGFNSTVNDLKIAPDGKIYVAGAFSVYNGAPASRVVRLNADGTLDPTFSVNIVVGSATAIALSGNDLVYVAGNFTTINGQPRNRFARLNAADGSLDATFNIGAGANNAVSDIAVQADGKVIIGGIFSNFSGTPRNGIARLNLDGSIDAGFINPTHYTQPQINQIAVQPDGKILFGGQFQLGGSFPGVITRVNADGTLDQGFQALEFWNESVLYAMHLQADGKILLGGSFNGASFVPVPNILRLNADGSYDNNFGSPTDGPNLDVNAIAVNTGGKIIVGGDFYNMDNAPTTLVTLQGLNSNGLADTSFRALMKSPAFINDIAVQPDGKILIAGDFFEIDGVPQFFVARLNANGSRDTTFSQQLGNDVLRLNTVNIHPNGKIWIGGLFKEIGNLQRFNIARLNADGTPDDFAALPDSEIQDIEIQPDGKVLVGGFFQLWNGFLNTRGFLRLESSGVIDNSFNVNALQLGLVYDISVQNNGNIALAGQLYVTFPTANTVVKLNSQGNVIHAFAFNPTRLAGLSVLAQNDGKIVFGGSASVGGVFRLNDAGGEDLTFTPVAVNNSVWEIKQQADGKILVGGTFSLVNNSVSRQSLARLNANGGLDTSFNFSISPVSSIYAIEPRPNGDIFVGGFFNQIGGVNRSTIAKITNRTHTVANDYDGDGKTDYGVFRPSDRVWYLQRSTAGFTAQQFGLATDKITPADFDGDGKTDIAVYRDGVWYLQRSTEGFTAISFGLAGDIPQPADFDGDGRAELAVFRPSNGTWYSLNLTSNQASSVNFGIATDKPFVGDYDGDGKADQAVYRDGTWYVLKSTGGNTIVQFGIATDKPVSGDFDGDAKTDFAVYRDGTWYILQTSNGQAAIFQFGLASDIPAVGDYDGDGKTDVAIWRETEGNFYVLQSGNSQAAVTRFGTSGDVPVASAYNQ